MYQQPYFIPRYYSSFGPSMMRGAAMNTAFRGLGTGRSLGLFSRIGNGFQALKSINWGGIINNTSKTLGLINQAIPVVKQVGPMMNNMKSMLKIASVFKDETDSPRKMRQHYTNSSATSLKNSSYQTTSTAQDINDVHDDYSPTFFVAS